MSQLNKSNLSNQIESSTSLNHIKHEEKKEEDTPSDSLKQEGEEISKAASLLSTTGVKLVTYIPTS
jgi:hypothetical protein